MNCKPDASFNLNYYLFWSEYSYNSVVHVKYSKGFYPTMHRSDLTNFMIFQNVHTEGCQQLTGFTSCNSWDTPGTKNRTLGLLALTTEIQKKLEILCCPSIVRGSNSPIAAAFQQVDTWTCSTNKSGRQAATNVFFPC